jgi:hypothetical protein
MAPGRYFVPVDGVVMMREVPTEEEVRANPELAVEQCQGCAAQLAKLTMFGCAWRKIQESKKKAESLARFSSAAATADGASAAASMVTE